MNNKSCYEFILNSGASFFLSNITSLDVKINSLDRTIDTLSIDGDDTVDKLEYINIKDIACIIKRDVIQPSKGWFRWKN